MDFEGAVAEAEEALALAAVQAQLQRVEVDATRSVGPLLAECARPDVRAGVAGSVYVLVPLESEVSEVCVCVFLCCLKACAGVACKGVVVVWGVWS